MESMMKPGQKSRIRNAADYGKVAVLMGGYSAERDISLETGKAVYDALRRKQVDAHVVDTGTDAFNRISSGYYDRAFIALHGRGGEDGLIQGALEILNIPYTGSNVLGSALTMDKTRTKWLWRSQGLSTPDFVELDTEDTFQNVASDVGFPVMVKPVNEGSSWGASKVNSQAQLREAWLKAKKYDQRVMAERWIEGKEYTAAIINDSLLPLIRLETPREFYDYEAKYIADSTRYICPCGLPPEIEAKIKKEILRAFKLAAAGGWGRVDFFVDETNRMWLLEVNTVPGMTSHSLVPMAAKHAGIGFDDLVMMILDTSIKETASLTETVQ